MRDFIPFHSPNQAQISIGICRLGKGDDRHLRNKRRKSRRGISIFCKADDGSDIKFLCTSIWIIDNVVPNLKVSLFFKSLNRSRWEILFVFRKEISKLFNCREYLILNYKSFHHHMRWAPAYQAFLLYEVHLKASFHQQDQHLHLELKQFHQQLL